MISIKMSTIEIEALGGYVLLGLKTQILQLSKTTNKMWFFFHLSSTLEIGVCCLSAASENVAAASGKPEQRACLLELTEQ